MTDLELALNAAERFEVLANEQTAEKQKEANLHRKIVELDDKLKTAKSRAQKTKDFVLGQLERLENLTEPLDVNGIEDIVSDIRGYIKKGGGWTNGS